MIDALLLSGGKGSRSENPALPKSLQQLTADLRVIDTIASSLNSLDSQQIGKIIAVLGRFHEIQASAFAQIDWPAELVIANSLDSGTSHAVLEGLRVASAEWVAVIAADSALSFDFQALHKFAEETSSDVVFAARYSNHPEDSDSLVISSDSRILEFIPKGETATELRLSASGVVLARRAALTELPTSGDFQTNLISLVRDHKLVARAWISRFYCRDTGTPARLQSSRLAFARGHAQFRGKRGIGGIFIDRDGTIISNSGDARKAVLPGEMDPSVAMAFLQANNQGVPIFIATNQPGVAKGKITSMDVERTMGGIQSELSSIGAVFDDYRYCPHHPEKGWLGEVKHLKVVCSCRKPSAGMAIELARHHVINLKKSWIIGDSDADQGFAAGLNAKFVRVSYERPNSVSNAIYMAIERIRNAG